MARSSASEPMNSSDNDVAATRPVAIRRRETGLDLELENESAAETIRLSEQGVDERRGGCSTEQHQRAESQQQDDDRQQPPFPAGLQHVPELAEHRAVALTRGNL